jgi:uncharacterized protein with NAD-binding domain and iron-sulfur cluster
MTTDKVKVAILGGGMGSIATAYSLTATPALRDKYDVTIYQIGWRIGGKGASGRNLDPEFGARIEEHGLHIWFGFYDNAFRMMRDCYQELARDPSLPLATFEAAFKPADDFVVYENYDHRWIPRLFRAPRNNRKPGNLETVPQFWEIAENALRWFLSFWVSTARPAATAKAPNSHLTLSGEGLKVAADLGLDLLHLQSIGPEGLIHVASELAAACVAGLTFPVDPFALLSTLLDDFRDWLWNDWAQNHLDDDDIRFLFTTFDLLTTILEGILADDVLGQGLSSINDKDFIEWLSDHGAKDITLETSVFVRMPYSAAFAFLAGDINQGNIAAGVALSVLLWSLFTYSGALFFKMQAGMGDTVFAPFYQVLLDRKVAFKFFHAVDRLHIANGSIVSIDVIEQVQLKADTYNPLVEFKRLPCWPSEPLWDQIVRGEALKRRFMRDGVDLEADRAPFGSEAKTLRLGADFHLVVLGISVEALKDICGELYEDDHKFQKMIDSSSTTMTQAFQLWLNKDVGHLGWRFGKQFIMSTYVEPLDTWADMSQLIPAEAWPAEAGVKSIQYFCGVIEDRDTDPPEDQSAVSARAKKNAINYLRHDAKEIWPSAFKRGRFDWNILIDPYDQAGQRRFDSQFVRANFSKSERYVLSPAGSIEYRLKTNGTKYTNLFLAGDWTDCGGNAGCVECAVTSGMLAARAIIGSQEKIRREDDMWLTPTSTTFTGALWGGVKTALSVAQIEAGQVAAAGIEFVTKVSRPTTPVSDPSLVEIGHRLLGDARATFDLGLEATMWSASTAAKIAKATPVQHGPIQPAPVARKIVIIGGGVAGMSAAQELAERGHKVEVYECQGIPGGKARSFGKAHTGENGLKDLPGEHGFRFFPGYYRHVIDTMRRIPCGRDKHVTDNLKSVEHVVFATADAPILIAPAEFPESWDAMLEALESLIKIARNVPAIESLWFLNRLLVYATSCDDRRLVKFEPRSWLEFTDATNRSEAFNKFYVQGMSRCAVACRADRISARTAATFILQLLFKLAAPGEQVDRVLVGPTNEVWIEPWLAYLKCLRVDYCTNSRLVKFNCNDKQITSVVINDPDGNECTVTADYYLVAIPFDKLKDLITAEMVKIDSDLALIKKLQCDWMNGIQFYFSEPPPIPPGHVVYFDSPWALTSISQELFWSNDRKISDTYGDGKVNAILSVDISNWDSMKNADDLTEQEIADEVLNQIRKHKGYSGPILSREQPLDRMLDPDIVIQPGKKITNSEPLLINVKDTWQYRPCAVTKIPNLLLASDYVRTYTDLATMEGANEAARCAVNGILDKTEHPFFDRCEVWPLQEPDILAPIRLLDQLLFNLGLDNPLDMTFAELEKHGGVNWLQTYSASLSNVGQLTDSEKTALFDMFKVLTGVQGALFDLI